MRRLLVLIAQLVALPNLLAGCNSPPDAHQAGANGNDQIAHAAASEMPPPIVTGLSYRCEDGSLIRVDYLAGDKQAILQTPENTLPIRLLGDQSGGTLTFGGYAVVGRGTTITFQRPNGPPQNCRG
ncbi:MAG: hypothetical protein EBR34_08275 [Sphingomonadaceae bacterium]|nr:hypothetical protein [Sphingomonadaceae bacterium]